MKRTASAVWQGGLKDGKGRLSTHSGVLSNTPYSFGTRFEDGVGTNPEELIAAAHAGCFSMMLSALLTKAGTPPEKIETECKVTQEVIDGAFTITKSELSTRASVPGISAEQFQETAENAKKNCPVSKALGGIPTITLKAELVG